MRISPTLLVSSLLFSLVSLSAIGQNTCGTATVITPASLPYSQSGLTTCGAVNDYTTADPGCTHSDMDGEDYVFSYTPTSDECIDIAVTNGNSSGGLFLMDDCPDVATSDCVEKAPASGTDRSLLNMPVEAGITYYIVVSCNSTCGCMSFDFDVTSSAPNAGETCCNPETMALPFSQTSLTTCGYVDDYSSADVCSSISSHIAEEDRFWTLTTGSAQCLNVQFTNITDADGAADPDIGFFVMEKCPLSPNRVCTAGSELDNATGSWQSFVAIPAAGTYNVVISSTGLASAVDCFSFDLAVSGSALSASGTTCASPISIGALPYSASGQSTCCMLDDYTDADLCTDGYMEGQDIVFSYTAAGAECIQIAITNTDGVSDVGCFVTDACPDVAGTCIAAETELNGGPSLEATLPGAGTYYIIVATDDDGECTDFDIDITSPGTTGSDCAGAISIGSFPYSYTGTTCCKGDDYSSSDVCGDTDMNGNDMVFTFTTVSTVCITATIADGSVSLDADPALFLSDLCPNDVSAVCLADADVTNSSSEDDGCTLQYTCPAGTYYLTVASDSDPQCTPFQLDITSAVDGAAAGSICAGAPSIDFATDLPYSETGSTTFCYGDDYSTAMGCASADMEGDDRVYLLNNNSGSSKCIIASLSNASTSAGLHLLDLCPDDGGVTCISMDGGASATVSGTIPNGSTYRLVVSSDGTPQFLDSYDLSVVEVSTGATGSDCANAETIASLPFSATGKSTYCYGDDYDNTDACGSVYMDGDDYVYKYTPSSDLCLDVVLSNTNSSCGLFLLDDCPDAGANCLSSDTGTDPSVGTTLSAGITYYIVISTDATPQGTPFDIAVTEKSTGTGSDWCTDPVNLSASPNTMAGEESSGTFTADEYVASPDGLISIFCGSIENNQWYQFIASATTAVFNFTTYGSGGGVQAEVYDTDGCCDNFTSVSNCWNPGTVANGTVTATGLTVGQIYLLMVDGFAGAVHTFDLEVASGVGNIPLPVDLLYFYGENKGSYNELRWETASELNSDFFSVERSTGDGEWHPIATLKASGTSNGTQSYMIKDEDPMFGKNYYRLITTDFDGSEEHSDIVTLDVTESEHPMVVTRLSPNPSDNFVNIGLNSQLDADVNVQVLDMTGRVLETNRWNISAGSNAYTLDLSDYASGLYHVAISTDSDMIQVSKLVKN